jgi:hypothetical protein
MPEDPLLELADHPRATGLSCPALFTGHGGKADRQIESPSCPITAAAAFCFLGHDGRADVASEELAATDGVRLEQREQVAQVAPDRC